MIQLQQNAKGRKKHLRQDRAEITLHLISAVLQPSAVFTFLSIQICMKYIKKLETFRTEQKERESHTKTATS